MGIYGKFVKHIAAPIVAQQSGLPFLFQNLHQLQQSQYWSRDMIARIQFERLRKLLIHAYQNTDFYKERFNDAGFDPYQIKDSEEIKKLPMLKKTEIRDNISRMIAKNFYARELHSSKTGGTTGVKINFYRDNACLSIKEAALYRFETWAGWDFGERMGVIWPATADYVGYHTWKAKLKNALFARQVSLPAALLNEEIIRNYVIIVRKTRPAIIRGFTSPIFEVAKYLWAKKIEIALRGVITTGEPLFKHQRDVIEKVFNCKVLDSYRTREAGPVAQQCEELDGLHINAECLYVEIEPQPGFEPGTGEIIITDLFNYGMPIIRYSIGDIGSLTFESCNCGRQLPKLKNIAGRTSEVFIGTGGKKIMAITLVLYLVDEAPGLLGQVQIIQDRVDHLIIRATPDPMPTDDIKNYQVNKVKELLGPEVEVSFQIVDKIPRESSGKYLFTVCNVKQ